MTQNTNPIRTNMAALQTLSYTKVCVKARVAVRAPKATVVCKASSSKAEVSTRRGMLSLGLMAAIAATAPKAKADIIGARASLVSTSPPPPTSTGVRRGTSCPSRSLVHPKAKWRRAVCATGDRRTRRRARARRAG